MIINNGFSLAGTITNQDINLTYTPSSDIHYFNYIVYKDGEIYIQKNALTVPVNFKFSETGYYSIKIQSFSDDTGLYSTITSPLYVVDKEKPVITVNNHTITIEKGASFNIYSNVVVKDNYDIDLKNNITTNYKSLNLKKVGKQELIYTVTDTAGNTSSSTVEINVVANPKEYLTYFYGSLILLWILIIFAVLRYRHGVKLENRISKFSVESLENNDISLFDKLFIFINKVVKKVSRFIEKSTIITKMAKKSERYAVLYEGRFAGIDFISIKFLFAILTTFFGLISLTIKMGIASLYFIFVPFIIGYLIMEIYFSINYKIYLNRIENDLLQAIIIMNNAFKSGRSISQAVQLVTTELDGPIAKEFSRIYLELSFGLDLNTVFKRFAERIKIDEATYLTASLTILNKTGGNIVKVFSAIEKSLFNKKKLKLELNAITSSSKIIKNVLFIVPVIFFVLIGLLDSSYFTVFFSSNLGLALFGIILVIYIIYIYVVNKVMKVRM